MNTRIKTTAGAILTTAMLGTLLPVVNIAHAEDSEFCDPVEAVTPVKKPRKVIKAKAPRKAGMSRVSARKPQAVKSGAGMQQVAKLVKAKPRKPLSFADRLRNKARRMMLAALGPTKTKMCRARPQDQLALLDKMMPSAGETKALLPSGGGAPFKFTPDTSIGPIGNIFGGRVLDASRVRAYSLPSSGNLGGGSGGSGGGNTSASARIEPAITKPVATTPVAATPGAITPVVTTPATTITPQNTQTSPATLAKPVVTNTPAIDTPATTTVPVCSASSVGIAASGGGTAACRDVTTGGGSTPNGGKGCSADGAPINGNGIPGGAVNPLPGNCGSSTGSSGGSGRDTAQVPEPAALSLLGLGLLVAGWQRRRKV